MVCAVCFSIFLSHHLISSSVHLQINAPMILINKMLSHIISYHIISYHIIYHIIPYHTISYHHVMSCHIIYYIISYLIYFIYHIISYHISYHIISYHIISCHMSYIIWYHIISYIISYHITYIFCLLMEEPVSQIFDCRTSNIPISNIRLASRSSFRNALGFPWIIMPYSVYTL